MNVVEYQYHKNDDEEASICTSHSALTVKQSNIKANTYTHSIITSKNSENLNNNAAGPRFATFRNFVARYPSLFRNEFGRPFTGDAAQRDSIDIIRSLVEEASNLRDDQEVFERFNSSFRRWQQENNEGQEELARSIHAPVDAVRENNVNADSSSELTSNDDQSVQNQGHHNSRSGNVARMPQESSTASADASNEGSGASKTDNSIDGSALAQAFGNNSDASWDVGGEPIPPLPNNPSAAAVSVNLSESSEQISGIVDTTTTLTMATSTAASAAANTNARAGNDNVSTSSEERKPSPSKKQKK